MKYALIPAGLLALTACSFAPDYAPPETTPPAAYKESGDWRPAAPADTAPKGEWWIQFGDSDLNALEAHIAADNQSLRAGTARLAEARAIAQSARADLFPHIDGGASADRLRRSQTMRPKTLPPIYNDDKLSLDVSYEVDLWGRVKNSVEAAADEAQASAADLAVLDLSIRSELATDYFSLRGADTSQQVLEQTIEADQAALDLVTRRHQGGIAASADVAQAKAQLELAKTQASDIRLKRSQLEHAIAILVGVAPAQFQLPAKPLTGEPLAFAVGQPSTLLERRPDVAAAERRVASANARIGIAKAAWFPVFNLGALIGLETSYPANLLQASSAIWALGPGALSQSIFDGGRIQAQNDQARAAFDEAVADYRQTTLSAWREVEDQLAALRYLESESVTQSNAVEAQREALAQARYRYQAGIVTFLEVVVNQNALLAAELTAADIHLRQMTANVLLIKGLGGGWQGNGQE